MIIDLKAAQQETAKQEFCLLMVTIFELMSAELVADLAAVVAKYQAKQLARKR